MNPWTNLVKIALLGTRRGPFELEIDNASLAQFWQKLPGDSAEHRLLSAAGSAAIYQQIGSSPALLPPAPLRETLPRDPRPPANSEIARLLASMLRGPRRDHLPECLAALGQAGWRLPARLAPNLLALGFRSPDLRPLIISLLSPSARHLALSHPEWRYASPAIDNWQEARQIWQSSSPISKTRFLQQLRTIRPGLARQLLESTWKGEQESARTTFIKKMETGLSLDDEPFLEMVLDDRNQIVRRRAAELLAAIPGSRLSQRMINHAKHFLSWAPSNSISIHFPTVSPQMVRDGIYGSRHKNPAYMRSKQLIQLIGAVPLDYWREHWHEDPQVIIQAAQATNWKRTLTSGFAEAAQRQNNGPWARAILWARGPERMSPKLVEVLAAADYIDWLDHLQALGFGQRDLNFSGPLFKSLRARRSIDDLDLAQKILPLVARYMRQEPAGDKANISAKRTFMTIAHRLPVQLLPEAEAIFSDKRQFTAPWQATAENIIQAMHFRQHMLQVIAKKEIASGQ